MNDNNIKINKYQIIHLFKNIRKLNGGKNLLARKLNITTPTLDEYLKSGQEFLEQYDDILQPIYEIDIDALDEEISKQKNEFIPDFLALSSDNCVTDKNRNAFEVYFIEQKEKIKEKYIYDFQEEIIENITFSENEKENKKIILLILFKLIYDRAQMSLDEELLYLKNRYSKSSSKHLSVLVKDLERRNKEDFGNVVEDNKQKQITFNQFNNFTHYSIQRDKAMGLLKKNETIEDKSEIIDADIINTETVNTDDE